MIDMKRDAGHRTFKEVTTACKPECWDVPAEFFGTSWQQYISLTALPLKKKNKHQFAGWSWGLALREMSVTIYENCHGIVIIKSSSLHWKKPAKCVFFFSKHQIHGQSTFFLKQFCLSAGKKHHYTPLN